MLCNDSPCLRESWLGNSARRDASPFRLFTPLDFAFPFPRPSLHGPAIRRRRLTPLDFAFPPLCQTPQRHSVALRGFSSQRHSFAMLHSAFPFHSATLLFHCLAVQIYAPPKQYASLQFSSNAIPGIAFRSPCTDWRGHATAAPCSTKRIHRATVPCGSEQSQSATQRYTAIHFRRINLPVRNRTVLCQSSATDQSHEACRSQATPPQASCRRKAS